MAKDQITDADLDLLAELEVDTSAKPVRQLTREEERVLAGFEDITRWVEREGRVPQHGAELDIFERMYAVRLERIRGLTQYHELLADYDPDGLLQPAFAKTGPPPVLDTDEDILLALGVEPAPAELSQLVHVRSSEERKASPEEVAQRQTCEDFETFAPIFVKARLGLDTGAWATTKYKEDASIELNDLFIVDGQTALVAAVGKEFVQEHGRRDRRLRVIYDNGTESDPLRRSLQRALNKDDTSRRLRPYDNGPLFAGTEAADDLTTGRLYVLRSRSDNPWIAEHRELVHKIGVTTGEVKTRIAGAALDATYLLADVEIVASYKLANVVPHKLEALVQRFFAEARLDVELRDRFDVPVHPREWFLVPLAAIESAVEHIREGTIGRYRYHLKRAAVVER